MGLDSNNETFDISILIRVRNESKALQRLLDSLKRQDFEGAFEVIVIDNESDDNSVKVALENGAQVFTLPRSLFSYGRAINVGIKRCRSKLVVLLSAHVCPQENSFLDMVFSKMGTHLNIDAMYFKQIPFQEIGDEEKLRFSIFPKESCVIDKDSVAKLVGIGQCLYKASYFSNSACVLRKNAVENNSMRDLPYSEENAFALDLILQGKCLLYSTNPVVYYEGPISTRRLYDQEFRRTVAEKILENKYGSYFAVTNNKYLEIFISLLNVIIIPIRYLKIIFKLVCFKNYTLTSRSFLYDFYSIRCPLARLNGIFNWKKFIKSFEVDISKLEEANAKTHEIKSNY